MPDMWMTIAAAAATLNVHTRTIERRIAGNKIQSRRTDDGQLQVMIDVPDSAPDMPSPLETVRELAQDQVHLATGSASAIVRLAQADADRARGELHLVRQDAGRARRGARLAWISVATMAAAICVAVGWTSYRAAQSREEIKSLNERAERVEFEAKRLLVECTDAKTQAEAARIATAEATGRLAAYQEQAKFAGETKSSKTPSTQPMTLMQRIASAVAGE